MDFKVVQLETNAALVRSQLERTLASPEFIQSERMNRFLRFVVTQTLAGKSDELKESVVGVHVFDRPAGYDLRSDPIVRSEARRLRAKLLEYAHNHPEDELWIELPKGGYVPEFHTRERAAHLVDHQVHTGSDVAAAILPHGETFWNRRGAIPLTIGLLAIVFVLLAVFVSRRTQSYSVLQARQFTTYAGYVHWPAFSPDGNTLAFTWGGPDGGSLSLWLQGVNEATPRRITASPTADTRPAWSPSGKLIAFVRAIDAARFALFTVDVETKAEKRLAVIGYAHSTVARVEWMPDGNSIITSGTGSNGTAALIRISVATGEQRQIALSGYAAGGDCEPVVSPDGRVMSFRRSSSNSIDDIYTIPLSDVIAGRPAKPHRVTFDGRSIGGHAWAPDGRSIIAATTRAGATLSLWRFPVSGGPPVRLTEAGIMATHLTVSSKGHRLAYENIIEDSNVWALPLERGAIAKPVIDSTMLDTSPQFSPDGKQIAYRSNRSGSDEVWIADANGRSAHQITHFNGPLTGSPRWSPDGRFLVFETRLGENAEIFIVSLESGQLRRFTNDPARDILPSWSHDGQWIYFASNRSGRSQIWKQPVVAGPAQQVTKNGGFASFESWDGKRLYYSKGESEGGIWSIPVMGGPETEVVPDLPADLWGAWAAGRNGLYFLAHTGGVDPHTARIMFFDFATGATREIGLTTRRPVRWDSALSVSSDERMLLFTQVDREGSNIFVADGFY